jgi:Ni/Co efflux regulator RcnB
MRKFVVPVLLAVTLCSAGGVMAQGGPGYDRHGRGDAGARGDDHDRRGPPGQRRDYDERRDRRDDGRYRDERHGRYDRHMDNRGPRGNAYGHDRRYPRGVGPGYAYYPGARLPPPYRTRQYVVDDWRGHRLSAPPRGYHWVQVGADYALVAVATGVILQMLLAN